MSNSNSTNSISAIRVADEAFLIASTIERCPKTMMLRELVMNALEAASLEQNAAKQVHIGAQDIDGALKLSIWNNGPGLSASELHKICDLASSIRKETGLDANFGMGAKVASLPSNKLGLRYRSRRGSIVNEVKLVHENGVYGRFRYNPRRSGVAGEIANVTELCAAENRLGEGDWTEVTLFGNAHDQNTLADPYGGDPYLEADWIAQYLSARFFRLPPGVSLTLPSTVPGQPGRPFVGLGSRLGLFDRTESVHTVGGITVHFGYSADPIAAAASRAADGLPNFVGQVGIVFRDELYGVLSDQAWLLNAPVFGFPFAGRQCSVFIELPDNYGVRPEAYRQFLRFVQGDQRQVYAPDFAAVVRNAVPVWLREIIASYGLPRLDYVTEISDELAALLAQLGVAAVSRNLPNARGIDVAKSPSSKPSQPKFEVAPEIISLRDPALIDERELQGRAARYYPQTHQLYINLTYSAAVRLQSQLDADFASAPDPEARALNSEDISAWIVTRQVARALAYTLAKKGAGWAEADIGRSQSPEALSIVADDYLALLGPARRRMAQSLGLPMPPDAETLAASGQTMWSLRASAELADAEQAARRAQATPGINPAPMLRRVSSIEQQRGNLPGAIVWAEQAIEADPADPVNFAHLAGLYKAQGNIEAAEVEIRRALALQPARPASFLITHSGLLSALGREDEAREAALLAVELAPEFANGYVHLAQLQIQAGEFDLALDTLRLGRERATGSVGRLMVAESTIGLKRNDIGFALERAHAAVEADPNDWWAYNHLSNVLVQQREYDAAEQAVRRALSLNTGNPARLLRQLGHIEAQRGNLNAAVDWHEQAIGCDPNEAYTHQALANLLVQLGRHEEAASEVRKAMEISGKPNAKLLRQLSNIASQQGDLAEAISLGREALAADPAESWSYMHLAQLLNRAQENEEAEQLLLAGLELKPEQASRFERLLSSIAEARKDQAAALLWAQRALQSDRGDVWNFIHLASVLQRSGRLEESEAVAREALDGPVSPSLRARLLRQLSALDYARLDLPSAIEWAAQAVAADPNDPMQHYHLSGLYLQTGQLEEAEAAVGEAVRLSTGESPEGIKRRFNEIQLQRQRLAEAGLV